MKILKKTVISILLVMIILSSMVPSSYADFTSEQEKQMQTFIYNYVENYGGYEKSTYSQGEVRAYIYDYTVANQHKMSYKRDTEKDIYGTITSDCSSFASFVYNETCNAGMRGWTTDTFKNYVGASKEDGNFLYDVGLLNNSDLKPGDLILAKGGGVGHIMVYYGDGKIAHMSSSKDLVIVDMGWVYSYYPSSIVHVLRINDNKFTGNLDTTIKNVENTYTPPSTDEGTDGNSDADNSNGGQYIEPQTGEDLGLEPDDFQYYGLPEIIDVQPNKPWVIPKLSDIIDYLVGLAILFPKMAFIGWTEIVESAITTTLDNVAGGDANIFTFIIDSSKNVTIEKIVYNRIPLLDVNVFNLEALTEYTGEENKEGESRDQKLYNMIKKIKETIAVWYYTFRNLVIIAMLAVLIYIGVRMAISTVAEEKAKYKSMIISWIVSFIIVIGIHFFMVLIMQLNSEMVNFIIPKEIAGEEISLYETVRSRAYELKASRAIAGTILYMVLVWYTLRFLVIYAKRFLSIMLLVLIAPFASASFAINKIKDGKTPIFDNWRKEYTFNIIIQGVHAILYTIFVSNALKLSEKSLAGVILAFILIKFMIESDKIVRKIFKMRSGSKYSSLDNNLSAGDELSQFVSSGGVMGMFTGSAIAKAYKKKWLKPMYGKYFGFAKGVLNVPYQGIKTGVVATARQHMVANNYNTDSGYSKFVNAIASTSLLNERKFLYDKYGKYEIGADGKRLYTENVNWQKMGWYKIKNGRLVYTESGISNRPINSDMDRIVALERARIRNENKKHAKELLSYGGNMIKGFTALALGIPLLIDSPMIGINLFLDAYKNLNPVYANKRKAAIKGFRKPVTKKRYAFKEFGDGVKRKIEYVSRHPLKTVGRVMEYATGAIIYTKAMENATYTAKDILEKAETNGKQMEIIYEIREKEADIVEDSKELANAVQSISDTSKVNAVTAELDTGIDEFAKKIYSYKFYKTLDKNIKANAGDFRMKSKLRNFAIEYAKKNHIRIDSNGIEKKVQEAIKKYDPTIRRNINLNTLDERRMKLLSKEIRKAVGIINKSQFDQALKDELNRRKLNGQIRVSETEIIDITLEFMKKTNISKNLRQINPKISNKTKKEEFELKLDDIGSITIVKEELRTTYGKELGRRFEDNLEDLLQQKRNSNDVVIKEKELQSFISDELKLQEEATKSVFTVNDIDGIKDEIDRFMLANNVNITFDDRLEQKIKDKIEEKTEVTTVKIGDRYKDTKVITIQELEDILHQSIEEREKPDETPILTKEEVVDLVEMIQERSTEKKIAFGKEFENSIQKLMQEEIVRSTIEEHVGEKYGDFTDEVSIEKLENKINSNLSANGYDTNVNEVLEAKDIISKLRGTVKENLEAEIEDRDMKKPKTDFSRLTDIVIDASRLENSINRKSPFDVVKEDLDIGKTKELDAKAEKLAQDVEKLRTLNFRAEKLGVKRTERRGKKIEEDKLTKDELKEAQKVVDLNNLINSIWNDAKKK